MKQDDSRYARYTGEHGFDNRYMSKEEMKAKLQCFPLDHPERVEGGGVPLIAEGRNLYLDAKDYHTLILGATGSMKTRVFVLPSIYTLGLKGENLVISDPKGEICERTSGWLKTQGYDVKIFNLREPAHSDCWNPLYEAFRLYRTGTLEGKDNARNLINDFIAFLGEKVHSDKDPYWEIQGSRFLEAAILLMFAFEQDYNRVSIRSLTSFFTAMSKDSSSNGTSDLAEMAANLPMESLIRDVFVGASALPDSTRNCLVGTMLSEIAPFISSTSVSYLTSHNTIDVHAFKDPEKKTALFIVVPDEKTTYHFLAASLVKQLYEVAVGDASVLPGFKLPRRLNFILDEFANMPRIPDMGSMISAARSRNIRFTLVVQNNSQLQKNYGHELAETIKANCLNWVYLNSKEMPLLEQLVQMGGTVRGGASEGDEPVVTMEALNALNKSYDGAEAVVFLNRSFPFMTFMPDIDKYGFPIYPSVRIESQISDFHSFNLLSDVFDVYSAQEINDTLAKAEGIASLEVDDGDEAIGFHHLKPRGLTPEEAAADKTKEAGGLKKNEPFKKPHN